MYNERMDPLTKVYNQSKFSCAIHLI